MSRSFVYWYFRDSASRLFGTTANRPILSDLIFAWWSCWWFSLHFILDPLKPRSVQLSQCFLPASMLSFTFLLGLFVLTHGCDGCNAFSWRKAVGGNRFRLWHIVSLLFLFIFLHWRHGMHLKTPFDPYVMNPHHRESLIAKSSPTLQLIENRSNQPSRTIGLDHNFFAGYGGAVGSNRSMAPTHSPISIIAR